MVVQTNVNCPRHQPFLADGGEMGRLTREYDWSGSVLGVPDQWPLSLLTTLGVVLHSAFPMFLFWGPEYTCFYNDAYRPSLGTNGKHPAVGQPAEKVWAEIWDFMGPLIMQVTQTKKPVWFEDQLVPIFRNGQLEDVYWTFSYSPAFGDNGEVHGMLVVCTETTEKVGHLRELQESKDRLRTLIEEASIATCLLVGPDMRIDIANERMLTFLGKDRSVIGQPLALAVPESNIEPYFNILTGVYSSGEAYQAQEMPVKLQVNGVVSNFYFDFTCTPLRDGTGKVYGVMNMAVDVTGQVIARQMLLQSERNLRNLILKAPVAICIFKGPKYVVEIANERMIEFWGRPSQQLLYRPIFDSLPEARDQGFESLLEEVYTTGKTCYAQGVPVRLPRGGKVETVYVNFVYEAYREPDNSISGIIAVASEVTEQVLARQQIEAVVSARTRELKDANQRLQKTNEELAQFAYVASHDLQEPLRKVSTFTEMLEKSLTTNSDLSLAHLQKIKVSTSRMITLVRDVLSFSQLSTAHKQFKSVDLARVINDVLVDYELLVEQKRATIEMGVMPVVEAIPLQMSQLFTNLIGNALKFSRDDVPVAITITTDILHDDPGIADLSYDPFTLYYRIGVKDNGIGFDQEFAEKIFQIFQRLHTVTDYAGTGIGLALCKKIMENHHGAIYPVSTRGEGAVFYLILPAMQSDKSHEAGAVPEQQ